MEPYASAPADHAPAWTGSLSAQEASERGRAFNTLFEAEYGRVVAIATRVLRSRAEAEDVAQDVFLQLHRGHDPRAP
jgi:RNA polymerase sigma-70 factor (ECF subfamily)